MVEWTRERHEAAKTREREATPGKWEAAASHFALRPGAQKVCRVGEFGSVVSYADGGSEDGDLEFIASAREDIPAMLAEIERAWGEIARLTAERDAEIAAGIEVHGALGAATADRARLLRASGVNRPGSSESSTRLAEASGERVRAVLLSAVRTAQNGEQGRREHLGRLVREEWVKWAQEQPNPKASWLVPWEGLSEPDKEVNRRIGVRLYSVGVLSVQPVTASLEETAPLTEAEAIVRAMPARYMTREEANNDYDGLHGPDLWFEGYACALREAAALLAASRGDIPEGVRPEADHADGDACPACTDVLGSPQPCAISHDFRPGAYDGAVPVRPDARPLLDQPVDVPHDIRLDKLSRFAGAEVGPVETKPGAACPDCHEDCIGWVVDGNRCGGAS